MSYIPAVVTATGASTPLVKAPNETTVLVTLYPTTGAVAYTGLSFTFEATMDGTNWEQVFLYNNSSGALISGGTSVSPADGANASYTWPNATNFTGLRVNVSAITAGSATFKFTGSQVVSPPFVAVTQGSAGSFTNGTFSGTLAVTGASTLTGAVTTGTTVSVGGKTFPTSDDGAALGDTTHNFSDLFLATGAVLNYANSNVVVTHTSGILTMGTGDFRVTTAGTNTASVVTVGGTQTLAAKTLTTPVIGVATGTSLAATGLITSSSPTTGIGYATGAGGAVTQSTDKTTGVTSNTITTAITLNNAALAAATIVAFTFTNSAIAATDTVICTHQSAGTSGAYLANAFPGAGSAVISLRNNSAGSLSEAIVLRVTVIKSVSA